MQACLSNNNGTTSNPGTFMVSVLRDLPPVLGTSQGLHSLKGITDKVHIVHCTLDEDV